MSVEYRECLSVYGEPCVPFYLDGIKHYECIIDPWWETGKNLCIIQIDGNGEALHVRYCEEGC